MLRKYSFRILLLIQALVLTFMLIGVNPVTTAHAAAVKIMPLGDSITGSPGCWRALLWNRLQTNGFTNIDFVGTLPPQGCGVPYDGDNEGHGGFLATNIASQNQLPPWLAATTPDIVIMHLGTNDVWNGIAPATILAAFSTLVDQMRASNPNMKILVAQILPMNPSGCSACAQRVIDFNATIPAWAASKSTAQSPIGVVDQWTGFNDATDTGDGVHPNDAGNQKMSDRWYPALSALLTPAGPTATLTRTPTRTNTPQGPTPTFTRSVTPTECLQVTGHVRVGSSTGPGLAGVSLVGTTPIGGRLLGTSDANGNYTLTGGCASPGSLTVTAQLTGYTFTPASQNFAGVAVDFVATATGPTATPTRTATWTITPTTMACNPPTPELLRVSPVTSPTNATTQVITVTLNHSTSVTVTDEAGSVTSTTPVGSVFSVTINLVPNSTNHVQVLGKVTYTQGCPPYSLLTTLDINGNPLNIVQGTVITPTPTRTPTQSPTPVGATCSPVTATVTAPFTHDGAGTFCWQIATIPSYTNNWNLVSLTINGVNYTGQYVAAGNLPAKINGFYYIAYTGNFAWSHFEAK